MEVTRARVVPLEYYVEVVVAGHRSAGERAAVNAVALIGEHDGVDVARQEAREQACVADERDLAVVRREDVAGRRDRVAGAGILRRLVEDRAEPFGRTLDAHADGARRKAGQRLAVPRHDGLDADVVARRGVDVIERQAVVEVLLDEEDVEGVRDVVARAGLVALHAHVPRPDVIPVARGDHVEGLDRSLGLLLTRLLHGRQSSRVQVDAGAVDVHVEREAVLRSPLQEEDGALGGRIDEERREGRRAGAGHRGVLLQRQSGRVALQDGHEEGGERVEHPLIVHRDE